MADVDFDEFDAGGSGGYVPAGRFGRVVHIAGAATSAALVIGLCIWGYKLAVRDVNGIPVVRALEGPMRIAPENPGGEIAAHQGLAVNRIAADGTAAPTADRLVLAPRAEDLAEDDMAGLSDPAPLADSEAADTTADPARPIVPVVAVTTPTEGNPTEDAVALALAEALSDGATPLTPLDDAGGTVEALEAAEPADPALANAFVKTSLRPVARPSGVASGSTEAAPETATIAPSVAEIDPATLKTGTRLIQLGAFDTGEEARAEWTKLQARFPDLMAGKALVVQSAESGGRTFFRLRAHGFEGEDDARRFCSALLAENAACIPVAFR